MIKLVRQIIMFILIISLFSNTLIMAAPTDDKDDEVVRTIDTINELRKVYNLPLLSFNDALNNTARIHNRYMDFNNTYSSIEETGNLYYRGRYPWDRASYNGYTKSYVFEALIKDSTTFENGLELLLQNPYARYNILDPLYSELGMSSYDEFTTYLFGGSERDDYVEVAYPYDNQYEVETTFDNRYIIDPYSKVEENSGNVGVPISYNVYSSEGKVKSFSNISVSLYDTKSNRYLDVKYFSSNSDRNLINSIMILPLESYNFNTTYDISIKANVTFDKEIKLDDGSRSSTSFINYEGSFTTKLSTVDLTQYSYVTRAQFVEDLMKLNDRLIRSYVIKDSLETIFPDVNVNSANYKYIYTAHSNKIINGYEDKLFRPNANITREQAYTVVIRNYEDIYGGIDLDIDDIELSYSDTESINKYAKESIYKAKKIGLLTDSEYKFEPTVYISIREFNDIILKYEKIAEDKEVSGDLVE